MSAETAAIAAMYADFGRDWARGTSPLYEEWSHGVSGDADMLARLAALPARKRQPNLIYAAARWEGCPLVPYRQCREWMRASWDRIVATALSRSTQTNEPNRCATLLPAFGRIEGPIALLEVGTAAGLCLYPDRYSVDYDTPSGARRLDPDAGRSPVTLVCRIDAVAEVPARMPEVVWRRGIDLSPIDAGAAESVEWLATLVWPGPDHADRITRLRAAAAVVAADPPHIVHGDLLDELTDVAASGPSDATLVVFHSAVLLYLDAARRERFADMMTLLARRIDRRVVWVANETVGTLPRIDAGLPPGVATHHRFMQTVDGRPIALAGQHGATYETAPFSR